ncbi:MAG: hypothetical protein PHY16_10955 [Methylobacter sp.]|nr:hypothetical protein [Methylobacter sp.]
MKSLRLLGIVGFTLISGCSQHKIGNVETLSLNASERLVFTHNGKICAEPSPDAVKSIAEAAAVKVKDYAEVSQSYSSALASIGLRTAGIQIIRDIGYRACEALSNDAFGSKYPDVYAGIINGADDAAVALVAIEGLTADQPPPAVIVSSSASSSTTTQPAEITSTPPANRVFNVEQTRAVADSVVKIVKAVICSSPNAKDRNVCK